jgi:hypothetical protein
MILMMPPAFAAVAGSQPAALSFHISLIFSRQRHYFQPLSSFFSRTLPQLLYAATPAFAEAAGRRQPRQRSSRAAFAIEHA